MKVKMNYTTDQCEKILKMIKTGHKHWVFANNPEHRDKLEAQLAEITKKRDADMSTFLLLDTGTLKKEYGEQFLTFVCDKIIALAAGVSSLESFRSKLVKSSAVMKTV